MAGQEPKNDPNAQNKSLLATDGETDSETRRIHSRTRGAINAVSVEIVDASGNQITSFGGGTQYADGVVRGTATGTLAMGDDGTNIQSVHVDASGDLQVDVLTMPTVAVTGTFWQATQPVSGTFWQATQPISGSVTANAGTNLNTSLLALESGGNLATIAGKDFATQTTLALIKAKTDNIPALGQALAAASVPVVLTDAQITTLTPPAAITGFALAATQTDKSQFTKITDGTDTLLVSVAGSAQVVLDAETTKVIGTVNQGTSPWIVAGGGTAGTAASGVVTVQGIASMTPVQVSQATASNLNATVVGTGTFVVQATLAAETTKVIGTINVAAGQTIAVTNAGTFVTQATLQAGTAEIGKLAAGTAEIGNVKNSGTFAVQATIAAGAAAIGKAEDVASVDADVGVPAMAVQKATPANTAGTDGDYEMLQMSAGRLWTSAKIDTALPAGTNAIGKLAANSGVDIGDVDILSIAAGDNNIGNVDIVTVPSDPFGANADAASVTGSISAKLRFIAGTGIPITGTVLVDTELPAAAALVNDTASPTAPAVGAFVMVRDVGDGNWDMMTAIQAAPNLAAADSGVAAVGLMAQLDDTSPTTITENQFGNLRMTSERALHVSPRAVTTGGATTVDKQTALSTTVQTVKSSAGTIYGGNIYNPNSAVEYVQCFNTTSAVTLGTTVPDYVFSIPGLTALGIAAVLGAVGLTFGTGIKIAATTTPTGNTAPGTGLVSYITYA